MYNVTCARCVRCGNEYEAVPAVETCRCGGILDIIYDYDAIRPTLTKAVLKERCEQSMWRYREILPR